MSHFLRATVKEQNTDSLVLELENGQTLTWPIDAARDTHLNLNKLSAGSELTLTLTHSQSVINELLGSNNSNEQ